MNYGIPSIKKIPLNNDIEFRSALFNFNRVNKFYKKELLESLIKINKNINKEVLLSENCCISKIFTDNIMSNLSLKIHNIRKNLIVSNIFVCFFVLWVYNQHKVIK